MTRAMTTANRWLTADIHYNEQMRGFPLDPRGQSHLRVA